MEIITKSMEYINIVVDVINGVFNKVTPDYEYVWVMLISIALAYWMKTHLLDTKKSHIYWWILFTLMIFMSLRYIGLG